MSALPEPNGFWLGVDPGGENSFGLALLHANEKLETYCVSSTDEAMSKINGEPLGMGIDAPLWWSSGRSSDRLADQWIRKTHKISAGTVQTANSLRGAALVQGVMFAFRMRERYPSVKITEVHPKALALALGGWSSERLHRLGLPSIDREHERDATLAAIAAREGFSKNWNLDLSITRHPSEQDPHDYWLSPIHYFWPQP